MIMLFNGDGKAMRLLGGGVAGVKDDEDGGSGDLFILRVIDNIF